MQIIKLKSKWILVATIILASCLTIYYVYSKKISRVLPSIPVIYSGIEILDKDEEFSIGFVRIDNKKIITNIDDSKLRQFIDANKTKWESSTLTYPTGGMMPDGSMWDGSKTTKINRGDHIISVYVILDEKFGNEYSIHLTK